MIADADKVLQFGELVRALVHHLSGSDPGKLRQAPRRAWMRSGPLACYQVDAHIGGRDGNLYVVAYMPGIEASGSDIHFGMQLIATHYIATSSLERGRRPTHIISINDTGIQVVSHPQAIRSDGTPTGRTGAVGHYYGANLSQALQEFFVLLRGGTVEEARTPLGAIAKVALFRALHQ